MRCKVDPPMATHDDVRKIGSRLPGALEGEGRCGLGVEVKGKVKGLCWTWMERVDPKKPKVENPDVLAMATPGLGAKEILMASKPEWWVEDPHYNGYPAVLVRLEAIEVDELEDLLVAAWTSKAPKAAVAEFEKASA